LSDRVRGEGMTRRVKVTLGLLAGVAMIGMTVVKVWAQEPAPVKPLKRQAKAAALAADPAAERGRKQFVESCGFCHGADATGARGPDLMRSAIVAHDVKGDLIGQMIHQGRPDKGMPPLPLRDDQVADIAAFLHARAAEGLASSEVPEAYSVARLLTGNADAGKAYFDGAGGCSGCHSTTGDLAGIATKYSAIDLESHMLYPDGHHSSVAVTLPSGEKIEGPLAHIDDFEVALRDASGWYRSFARDRVKVEVNDRLAAHRELLDKLTQADMHNLFAYLQGLK
jgi:cytochrome c oxidase cbb3-type subunit 3